ncbi:MAG: methionyl-tRNA formyltransferase [Candidatus Uhrbacteria bacterium]|nr:methionyl-tRNA formyltransferase [Candidatus Uhrbacteria bacterium]
MKIVFFGTDEFAAIVLERLIAEHAGVCAIVSTPDKPAGRNKTLRMSAVTVSAKKYGLPILQPETFDEHVREAIRTYNADVGLLTVYGKILPQTVLELFPKGIVNIHPSLLPLYRGVSPIKTALLNGDRETGITIIVLDDKMDHGPILAQSKTDILPDEKLPNLRNRLALMGATVVRDMLPKYVAGNMLPVPQDHARATYTKLLTKEDGRIQWSKSRQEIYNQFRALYDWPGTWTEWRGKRIKILEIKPADVTPQNTEVNDIFFVLDKHLYAICGNAESFQITQLQVEGKNAVTGTAFIHGYLS